MKVSGSRLNAEGNRVVSDNPRYDGRIMRPRFAYGVQKDCTPALRSAINTLLFSSRIARRGGCGCTPGAPRHALAVSEAVSDDPLEKMILAEAVEGAIRAARESSESCAQEREWVMTQRARGLTLDAIGKQLDITRERVRQIQNTTTRAVRESFA